ncbi:MAG: thermonuclease family protein [Sphingomicrobium sp.]
MIKPSKPRRQTVELRPSRIRRDPVRLKSPVEPKPESPEREAWSTVAGVTALAVAGTILVVGFGVATAYISVAAAEPPRPPFDQCYNGGPTCVLDGDTIYVRGARVEIAGLDTPKIQGAACDEERDRGIAAAVQLAGLLNGGRVSVGAGERGPDGRVLRKVEVDGRDVGLAMVDAGVARTDASGGSWCGT